MASLLRQLVAGPRARHPEAGIDLCYVTDHIIATSGPSQTYPQRAYRTPLDRLVAFLDEKHGENWAIWEFRAEGTGYPDDAVYGRIRHYPWPDHHPPPFRLVPMIMASMRSWLHGGALDGSEGGVPGDKAQRIVVVHCKAGKGRSGSMACSYLISEEGWAAEDALARFTQRRMRPKFGAGVSIPSQLRWVGYVDRWAKTGQKQYVDRAVEVVEVHVWGLRNGVKVDVSGFADEGKRIQVLHTFNKEERILVQGGAPRGGGLSDMIWEMAGYTVNQGDEKAPEGADLAAAANNETPERVKTAPPEDDATKSGSRLSKLKSQTSPLPATPAIRDASPSSSSSSNLSTEPPSGPEPGGMAVVLRPKTPIRISTSDINVSFERRARSSKSMGVTMTSAVGHVWFNTYFEGRGPEMPGGNPHDSGVFAIRWDEMDGIKGSSRKGTRALDRLAVVWRAVKEDGGEEIDEPREGVPVPQAKAADWTGEGRVDDRGADEDAEGKSLEGVKSSGPEGEDLVDRDTDAEKKA